MELRVFFYCVIALLRYCVNALVAVRHTPPCGHPSPRGDVADAFVSLFTIHWSLVTIHYLNICDYDLRSGEGGVGLVFEAFGAELEGEEVVVDGFGLVQLGGFDADVHTRMLEEVLLVGVEDGR